MPPARATAGPGSGSSWYTTAIAYRDSVLQSYSIDIPNGVLGAEQATCASIEPDGSCTPEERAAVTQAEALHFEVATKSLSAHLAFMSSNPPAQCFRDAYTADRKIANAWLGLLLPGTSWASLGNNPEGRALQTEIDAATSQTNTFLRELSGYFTDCH